MTITDLPALNASLNALSALFLLLGYRFIKKGNIARHRICLWTAVTTSILFLIFYLIYHYHTGSRSFPGQGRVRILYFAILISHTVLAAFIVPLVLITLTRALKGKFDVHRRIARWTFPLWLYVSLTGVVIYLMLYQIYAP
ncbi:MAG: DUF420 domain-containing protein [Acidobacteria bacterium]|nr:DUF420 domain-containing protein [Acidobacteriota bacterium]